MDKPAVNIYIYIESKNLTHGETSEELQVVIFGEKLSKRTEVRW